MDKQDMQKPKKLSLKRETVRLLSKPDGELNGRKELTSPYCTEGGPKCDL
ncbi:hypothetical protein HMI49_06505 [Corallococcus exercitus]|uniref:Uncharacterized protein n=1 Tax=Corallococcus exercitus TaxID=2316736 RepID=A0A7Y4KFE6_9BACT|nr:hypothetical protein [Corallococcus exercitus]NOK32846.1 hypothetical protein [Corallococcus exercitus]